MIVVAIISILYFILLTYLIVGFGKVSVFKIKKNTIEQQFSILIPFRNESNNIPILAKSLEALQYPKAQFEILWINDGSTDNSVPIVTEYIIKNTNWKLLDNKRKSNSPKKDAINTAILQANYDWIITTDADCEVPINWLQSFGEFIQYYKEKSQHITMIAAPVAYKTKKKFLHNFQNMDFLSLIGTTIGSFGIGKPFMCNGANLCYKKQTFFDVNGFDGNDNIASGDDVFLLEKVLKKEKNAVKYLKTQDALVFTKPEETIAGLLQQRIRWASKTAATNNWFGKAVGILVFLMNLFIAIGFISCLFKPELINTFLILFLLKFNIDFLLILKTYRFVGLYNGIKAYIFSSVLYPFFVVYVAFLSFFKKVVWKGRSS